MSDRKVGVIGVRNVGMGHVRSWAATEGTKLVAIADLDEKRRSAACDEVGGAVGYGDYRELLEKSDAEIVSVCLPTGIHEKVVVDCLRSGRHVLCEKPPAGNAAEAERMAAVAGEEGRILGYSLQRRYDAAVQAARAAARAGRIGDPFYGRAGWVRNSPWAVASQGWGTPWRFDARKGGGSMLDLGVHLLDVAWYVMGCPRPLSVSGFVSSRYLPTYFGGDVVNDIEEPADDSAAALIRFEGDRAILLESSFGLYRDADNETYCDVTGTEGGLKVYPPVVITRAGERERLEPDDSHGGAREGIVADFLSAVNSGSEPCVSSEQGIMLMRIFDGVRRSHSEQREIDLTGDGS